MSPTVYRENGYRYFFFSKEEERIHIHIVSGDGEAKFWLKPEIDLAKNYNYSAKQLKEIESVIKKHYDEFINEWKKHFSS
jgi:diadenosine tetraphosphate (Ap4A) HIT family hydrolase